MARYLRRRRPLKKRPMRPRKMMRKKVANQVHRFIRWGESGGTYSATGLSLITAAATPQNLSYSFNLRDVVNAVDFTALYDMYRINKVTIFLERFWNSTGDAVAAQPNNRKIRVVHDYNDNNLLTTEDQYLEYANCKSYNVVGNGTAKIVLYPKLAQVIENVGGTQGFNAVPSNKVWLNTTDDQIPHFGIKMFIPQDIQAPGVPLLFVRVKFDLSFKNSK